jgi:predicted dehydrogenase
MLQDGRPVTRADVKTGDEGVGPLAGNEVHARFETQGGIPVFFDSIANAGVREAGFGVQLIGTKGVIDFRIDVEPFAHLLAGNPFQPVKDARQWIPISTAGVGKPEPVANLGRQLMGHVISGRDLIAAVREGREPLCSASDGALTVEMVCAVFESHRQNGRRVALPLKERDHPLGKL